MYNAQIMDIIPVLESCIIVFKLEVYYTNYNS